MTAISYGGETPTVGGDEDTWGAELNTALTEIKADLDMLNAATANSILGRNEGTSGEVERLTPAEVAAMLPAVIGDSGSGGVKGLVPAPSAGDAAADKVLTAAGTWGDLHGERKAWASVTGTTVNAGRNVASVVSGGTGIYDVTFTSALSSANYAVLVTARRSAKSWTTVTSVGASGFTVLFSSDLGALDPDGFSFEVLAD